MYKYWYAVEKQGAFYIGFCFGRADNTEEELIEIMQEYCKGKNYRLALLINLMPKIGIVNQIYPFVCTEESRMCLEEVLKVAI